MAKLLLCLLGAITIAGIYAQSVDRGTPPAIVIPQGNTWPKPKEYVRKSTKETVKCKAKGTPPPEYMWLLNGQDVNDLPIGTIPPHNVSYNKQTGDLNFGMYFNSVSSGDYQCVAFNAHGKTMTPFKQIYATDAVAFPGTPTSEPTVITAYASEYKTIECKDVPKSIPPWNFLWEYGIMDPTSTTMTSQDIQNNSRMIIDPKGTLHILWVEMTDNNYIFTCSTENDIIQLQVKNTKSNRLVVLDGDTSSSRGPELSYQKDITARVGEDATLTCIFSYYSVPKEPLIIEWIFKGDKVLNDKGQPARGETLTLKNLRYPSGDDSQEGEYMCNATVGTKSQQGKINLKIVASPKFLPNEDLSAMSVPLGNDAVFHCGTTSHRSYIKPPVWFINAEPILGCRPGEFECKQKSPEGLPICLPGSEECDGIPACSDHSDEHCNTVSCIEGMKECNGVCINKDTTCAETAKCHWKSFECWDGSGCVEKKMKCDGNNDCDDGSDEAVCPGGPNITVGRYVFNSQRSQLIVPQVQLNDTMCFQCMVTNDYGTLVGDGCLTVINKIEMVYGPNDTYDIEPGMYLNIGVDATTDPIWQEHMKYEWYWFKTIKKKNGETKVVQEQLPPEDFGAFFAISQSGQNLTIIIPEVDPKREATYEDYNTIKERQYAVVISHQYDRVTKDFVLIGEDILPPVPDKVVVQAASANLWFIALIVAILILFVVVALIVCYMYRNRGGTYLLDKKEHQAGHDPEQELKDSGFHDVGRIGDDYDDGRKPDEVSLSESVKPYDSDEDITEEYGGDFDVSKFNEDGSFIGLYGDKKSKYSGGPKEATV